MNLLRKRGGKEPTVKRKSVVPGRFPFSFVSAIPFRALNLWILLRFGTSISFALNLLHFGSIQLKYNELFTLLTHSTHQNNSWGSVMVTQVRCIQRG
jgi:hypothetical protein